MIYENDIEWFKASPSHWYVGDVRNELRVLRRYVLSSDFYVQKKTGRLVKREIIETTHVSPVDEKSAQWYRDGMAQGFDYAMAQNNYWAAQHVIEREREAEWKKFEDELLRQCEEDD